MAPNKKWWQILQSYFSDVGIEQIISEQNPELEVVMHRGRYQLLSANAIYSYEDKYDNFGKVFELIDWQKFKPKNTLVLGLGLGSVIQILNNIHQLDTRYTAVEKDDVVIYLAEKYILSGMDANTEIYCADAEIFMMQNRETYDLILMDIFDDVDIPDKFLEIDFLQLLKESLAHNGLLIFNSLASLPEDKVKSQSFFDNNFKAVFPDGLLLDVHQNYMLVNQNYFLAG